MVVNELLEIERTGGTWRFWQCPTMIAHPRDLEKGRTSGSDLDPGSLLGRPGTSRPRPARLTAKLNV